MLNKAVVLKLVVIKIMFGHFQVYSVIIMYFLGTFKCNIPFQGMGNFQNSIFLSQFFYYSEVFPNPTETCMEHVHALGDNF